MAAFRGVSLTTVYLSLLLLSECELSAQEFVDAPCLKPWYFSFSKDITLSWTGDERDATILANITTEDTYQRDCDAKKSLVAKFRDRSISLENPCSNALYSVVVTLKCEKVAQHQNLTMRTPPDAPTDITFLRTNTSIVVKWSPPAGRIQIYRVTCHGDERRDAQQREHETSQAFWTFDGLTPNTEYRFTVTAKNEDHWGKSSPEATERTQEGVPFAPRHLVVKEVTTDSIALEWDVPEPDMGVISIYSIQWAEDGKDPSEDDSNTTSYVMKGLRPYTEYSMSVCAINKIGSGPPSNLTQKTRLAVPDAPLLEVVSFTNTSITVRWKLSDEYRGPDPTYQIQWKLDDSEAITRDIQETSREGTHTERNLKPFTNYSIRIRAENGAGLGYWSISVTAMTLPGIPSSPQNLRVVNKSSNHIEITWDVPDPPYGTILRYDVELSIENIIGSEFRVRTTTEASFLLENLEPYVECHFRVCGVTKAGVGNWSSLLTVRTDVGVPSEPLNLTVTSRTSDGIEIEWTAPERKNAPYLAYLIRWMETEGDQESEAEVNVTTLYHVRHLETYTHYSIQVCGKTSAGLGNFTEPLVVQTKAGVPSRPSEVKAVNVRPTEIMIEWTAPEKTHGPLKGYELRWGVEGTYGSVLSTTFSFYKALGLRPYTRYFFEVAASTEGGVGPSHFIYQKTGIFTPSVPMHLQVASVSEHSVFLEWHPPENPNAPFLQYSIEWSRDASNIEQSDDTNVTSYTISSLAAFTNYSVRVSPRNAAGRGPATEWVYIQTKKKDRSTAVISGSVVGGLILILSIGGALLFYFLRKKRRIEKCEPTEKPPSMSGVAIPLEPIEHSWKISIESFDEHILKLSLNGYYQVAQEFEQLGRQSPGFSMNEGKKSDNLAKNRWMKILPFDHCRVKLLPIGDEVEPDYINASYVPGESYLLEYIAAQGPLPTTVDDFWKMVWQESVFLIVNLTQCVERAKKTCEQYWPSIGTNARYGDIEVMAVSEDVAPTFRQKLFLVSQGSKYRHIVQLHYMNWPVSGCPKSPDDFLMFIQTVRLQARFAQTSGPLLVHCSAGIGRTGTFIAVDRLSHQLSRMCKMIDVFGTVLDMRRYRHNLVQTEEQYYFIHLCIQRMLHQKQMNEDQDDYGHGMYAN